MSKQEAPLSQHPHINSSDRLTATDIFAYITCPHWPWFDRYASVEERALKREFTDGERKRMNDGYMHEKKVMEGLMKGEEVRVIESVGDASVLFEATLQAMRDGAKCIYQGTLLHGDWLGRPDLLIREQRASSLGNWHYIPIDIKSSHELKKVHKFQLTFYSLLLEKIQGVFPERAGIRNRENEPHDFDPSEMVKETKEVVEAIDRIRKGEKPEPVVRKACFDTSPWGKACLTYAQKTDDIALLYNVDVRKLHHLRGLGIQTVEDAAKMNPTDYVGAEQGLTLHALEMLKLQARSLSTGDVFVKERAEFEDSDCEVYFDIESDLPNDVDYLYGFFIRYRDRDEIVRFVAEKPDDEGRMWKEFLVWLEGLPSTYVVYHYAPFEPTRLRLLERRYGGSAWLDLFISRFVDLKPIATKRLTLPLYFYSLKNICKFFGFSWSGDLQSGGASIDYYERWCETGDRKILNDIIVYNEDDVRATAFLKTWLETYAREARSYAKPYPWEKR